MTATDAGPADTILISRAIQGDTNAFGDLYDRYLDQVYNYIFYQVSNTQETEDLTETVFLKAFESLSRFNQSQTVENFRAWIFRIARNQVVDYYRTRKPSVSIESSLPLRSTDPQPEAAVQLSQEYQDMMEAFDKLDPTFRQVLTCRLIDGLSHRETARIMNLKENHVRILQYRALKKIRQLLTLETTI